MACAALFIDALGSSLPLFTLIMEPPDVVWLSE
jgi:hypothetical protein